LLVTRVSSTISERGIYEVKHLTLGLAVSLLFVAGSAHATLVTPGGPTVLVPGTTTASLGPLVLDASATGTWSAGPSSGTFSDAVYEDTATGDLDFVYQFSETAGSPVTQTSSEFFGNGFSTNVFYLLDGSSLPALPAGSFTDGTVATITAQRSLAESLTFTYAFPGVAPGQTGRAIVIETDATKYVTESMGAGAIAGLTANVPGFGPAIVPEPAMFLPLGAGLLALVAWRRRVTQRA
jgi:hypothetical protein